MYNSMGVSPCPEDARPPDKTVKSKGAGADLTKIQPAGIRTKSGGAPSRGTGKGPAGSGLSLGSSTAAAKTQLFSGHGGPKDDQSYAFLATFSIN